MPAEALYRHEFPDAALTHRHEAGSVDQNADHAAGDERQDERQREVHPRLKRHAGNVAAHHEHRAVRKVRQFKHAENHRIPDRDQRVEAADGQAVDNLL